VRGQGIFTLARLGQGLAERSRTPEAINPISKTNWEGTGVEPDVKVPAADTLATAQKLTAEKLASK